MLERVWRKGNPLTLLVGMQTSTVTMENSVEIDLTFSSHACVLSRFIHLQLLATLWTVARQAPLPMGFSQQEYWSGVATPPPRGPY